MKFAVYSGLERILVQVLIGDKEPPKSRVPFYERNMCEGQLLSNSKNGENLRSQFPCAWGYPSPTSLETRGGFGRHGLRSGWIYEDVIAFIWLGRNCTMLYKKKIVVFLCSVWIHVKDIYHQRYRILHVHYYILLNMSQDEDFNLIFISVLTKLQEINQTSRAYQPISCSFLPGAVMVMISIKDELKRVNSWIIM